MQLIEKLKKLTWRKKSIILYAIALFTPIFFWDLTLVGFWAILVGWLGIINFEPTIGLPWIANFIYFFILIFKKINPWILLLLSISTIFLGLFSIGITEIVGERLEEPKAVTVGLGFMLWISSFISILMEQATRLKNKNVG